MRRPTTLQPELFVREQVLEAASLSEGHVCGDCLVDPPPYKRARSAAVYRGGVSRSIALLKYGGELHQVRALRALAEESLLAALPPGAGPGSASNYDLILPLPISTRRLAERGFNQATELVRAIYRSWAGLIDELALVRTGGEIHQAALSGSKRRQAIRGCFQVPEPGRVRGARILLFDDVLTTGATAGEAASTLLAAGARQVDLATIARAVLDSWR
jgi:ComF family protein